VPRLHPLLGDGPSRTAMRRAGDAELFRILRDEFDLTRAGVRVPSAQQRL